MSRVLTSIWYLIFMIPIKLIAALRAGSRRRADVLNIRLEKQLPAPLIEAAHVIPAGQGHFQVRSGGVRL
jgi:hypothetical protein